MPMIIVRFLTPREDEGLRPRIAELARNLAQERLGKDLGVAAVLVEAADLQKLVHRGRKAGPGRTDGVLARRHAGK